MPAHTPKDAALKINKVLNEFGRSPLHGTELADPRSLKASPEIVLAMALDALIKARPISHELTQKTIKVLIEASYHDINVLSETTWEDRTMVLQDGGYNRYREQGATNLGELAKLVVERYGGMGDLAVEVFFNNVQSIWPSFAPSIDSRSLKTADEIGIGTDVDEIYNALEQDPMRMSWFANGLSEVRLERRQDVIEEL
ncbi:hypothetical protein N7505_005075 [Penicillium chrysogenum]|uniref:Uncharacterized protein n=1 Tax=Penicillium chrysogenum TaxID=5076 RepID=A0ABQ8WGX2_PENCH|nr:hypothetical protein N7505_005075 [Penicillium chrysogenum]